MSENPSLVGVSGLFHSYEARLFQVQQESSLQPYTEIRMSDELCHANGLA